MPGEATSPAASLIAHLDLANPIRQHRRHGRRVVGGIVTVDEVTGDAVLNDLAKPADGRGHDRSAEGLRLQRHEPEALRE
jgi:hypothetical protein